MLRAARTGVAMGNAVPLVTEAADAVTASNNEDGVAEAIERYVLGR
jgi:hydroxymethylpyrimidine pyrophosphatase-like HAD family hydrolase